MIIVVSQGHDICTHSGSLVHSSSGVLYVQLFKRLAPCWQDIFVHKLSHQLVWLVRILRYTLSTMKVHVRSRKFSLICELPYLLWISLSVKIHQLQCNIPSNTYHAVHVASYTKYGSTFKCEYACTMMCAYTYIDNLGIVIMLAHAHPKTENILLNSPSVGLTQAHSNTWLGLMTCNIV